MSRNLNNMSIDAFIHSFADELSTLSSPNYTQALTREDLINARNIMSGATHPMIAPPILKTYYPSNVEEVNMSERMPKRAKIIKLISNNNVEDEMYVQYVGMTFDVVSDGSTYRGIKGYRLCLDKNDPGLNEVRFGIDELELYYDDEMKGEY